MVDLRIFRTVTAKNGLKMGRKRECRFLGGRYAGFSVRFDVERYSGSLGRLHREAPSGAIRPAGVIGLERLKAIELDSLNRP